MPKQKPKQKLEVNENLNVSIGDILKPETPEGDGLSHAGADAPREMPDTGSAKSPKTDASRDSGTKSTLPKFGKVSVQHQRAGRGGKTVTLVSLSKETEYKHTHYLEKLLKELKKSLGCGGRIEDGKIVLQGEIADRVSEWFAKAAAKKGSNDAGN